MIVDKLTENHRCLYLNSREMVVELRSRLEESWLDVEHEIKLGALVLSSSQDHLVDGSFDVDNMLDMLEAAVKAALKDGYTGLFATGDMTWELGPGPRLGSLIAYECGLEDLFRQYPTLSGVCQYHLDTLPANAVLPALRTHRGSYVNEMLSRLNPFYGPDRADASEPIAPVQIQNEMLCWVRAQHC